MERGDFVKEAGKALEHIEDGLAELEHPKLDVDLAGDVLTIGFENGSDFIINAHSAASQIWMAADRNAWHFDYQPETDTWIAHKTNDELMSTVARAVGARLGIDFSL